MHRLKQAELPVDPDWSTTLHAALTMLGDAMSVCTPEAWLRASSKARSIAVRRKDGHEVFVAPPLSPGHSNRTSRRGSGSSKAKSHRRRSPLSAEVLMDECMQIVGVDDIMDILLTEWQRDMRARRRSHILNIFEAGDVDGDSVLTAAEFEGIVRRIDPSTDSSKCLSMYREALQLSPAEGLVDKTTFLCIATAPPCASCISP